MIHWPRGDDERIIDCYGWQFAKADLGEPRQMSCLQGTLRMDGVSHADTVTTRLRGRGSGKIRNRHADGAF